MDVQQMHRAIARHRKNPRSPKIEETLKVVTALQTDWTKRDIDVDYALARRNDRDADIERWYFVSNYQYQRGKLDGCEAIYVPQFSTPLQQKIPPACGLLRKNLMGVCATACSLHRYYGSLLICRCRRWAKSEDTIVQKGRSIEIFELCLNCMTHHPYENMRFEDRNDFAISPLIYHSPS